MNGLKLVACLFVLTLIQSCASRAPLDEALKDPATLKQWGFEGKAGLRNNGKAQSAFINWEQKNDDFRIELHGPFGKGLTIIEQSKGQIQLIDDEKSTSASSAEELLAQTTGLQMPVSRLQWWLRGLAAPSIKVTNIELDEFGTLNKFQQQNWQVSISRFVNVDGYKLPERIVVENQAYRLTVVLKSWQLSTPKTAILQP